jgi:hypothetical protein
LSTHDFDSTNHLVADCLTHPLVDCRHIYHYIIRAYIMSMSSGFTHTISSTAAGVPPALIRCIISTAAAGNQGHPTCPSCLCPGFRQPCISSKTETAQHGACVAEHQSPKGLQYGSEGSKLCKLVWQARRANSSHYHPTSPALPCLWFWPFLSPTALKPAGHLFRYTCPCHTRLAGSWQLACHTNSSHYHPTRPSWSCLYPWQFCRLLL